MDLRTCTHELNIHSCIHKVLSSVNTGFDFSNFHSLECVYVVHKQNTSTFLKEVMT